MMRMVSMIDPYLPGREGARPVPVGRAGRTRETHRREPRDAQIFLAAVRLAASLAS